MLYVIGHEFLYIGICVFARCVLCFFVVEIFPQNSISKTAKCYCKVCALKISVAHLIGPMYYLYLHVISTASGVIIRVYVKMRACHIWDKYLNNTCLGFNIIFIETFHHFM